MSAPDDLPPDFDRHADALVIVEAGACNPSGLSITLHHACRQVLAEGGRQRHDPAVRLIGLQLAHLLGVARILDPADYARLIETCRSRAAERGNSLPHLIQHVPGPRRPEAGQPARGRPGEPAREHPRR